MKLSNFLNEITKGYTNKGDSQKQNSYFLDLYRKLRSQSPNVYKNNAIDYNPENI